MLFGIVDGLPYYVANGRVYPVSILPDGTIEKIDFENGAIADCEGVFTVREIIAKCERLNSIKTPEKKRRKKDVL